MPTVSVDKERFYQALGRPYTRDEFDELCFQFGIELDDDTTEEVKKAGNGERPTLKIDIPANRYDLLCHEGISRALLVFLNKQEQPKLKITPPPSGRTVQLKVSKETAQIRPFAAAAILRNITFTPENYAHFIDLQDKLHQNLGRRRTLVSMGTHDLDKCSLSSEAPTVTYQAKAPESIRFAPLGKTEVLNAAELMKVYEQDRHLGKYLHIIQDSPVYPVMGDDEGVLSLPPIINSERTKITTATRNVFIDITATDKTKMDIALNVIVEMFAGYCDQPFTVEQVLTVSPDGSSHLTPDLSPTPFVASVAYINSCTGLSLSSTEICTFLGRMGHIATPTPNAPAGSETVNVLVPPTRPDILHPCDLMEDVAIAYGFDNLPRRFPQTNTVATPLPINKLGDIVRKECAYSGWVEVLPLILCSHDENFAHLRQKDPGDIAIVLENPKTAEYQVVRTTLLPGLFKSIRENRKHSLPLKIFEVSDVAFKDEATDPQRGARNERHVAALWCAKTAAFEQVHGLLDQIMGKLGVKRIDRHNTSKERAYYIAEAENSTYFPGRTASIFFRPGPAKAATASAAAPTTSEPIPTSMSNTTTSGTEGASPLAAPPASAASRVEDAGARALDSMTAALANAASGVLGKVLPGSTPGADIEIGHLGVVHPEVLKAFDVDFPCSALEFNLEVFL